MRHPYRSMLAIAAVGVALAGCQQAGQAGAAGPTATGKPVVRWTSLLCTPSVRGVAVSVHNVPMGARVVFQAEPANAEELRDTVASHAEPESGRVPTDPVVATNVLPEDTRVTIEEVIGGTAVTYAGSNAAEQETIRNVVGPAAQSLGTGQCTMLQAVGWEPAYRGGDRDTDEPAGGDTPRRDATERLPRMFR